MDFDFRKFICGQKFSKYLPEWVCKPPDREGCFGKIPGRPNPEITGKFNEEFKNAKKEHYNQLFGDLKCS